jgi:hypothetical protein
MAPQRDLGLVLLGFGESPSTAEAARSLREAGFRVAVFIRHDRHGVIRRTHGIRASAVTAPEEDARRCREDLLRLARRVRPVAVLALDDLALWLANGGTLDLGARVVGPTGPRLALATDRRVQLSGAELVGLAVPAARLCRTRADLLALSAPVTLQPALTVDEHEGRLAATVSHRCGVQRTLERIAQRWDERIPWIAQPRVRGREEGLTGVATALGVNALGAQAAVSRARPGVFRAVTPDPDVLRACLALLGDADWRGPFTLRFVRDADGHAWFVCLEGRLPESLTLFRLNGLEHPALAVADALGLPSRAPDLAQAGELLPRLALWPAPL